MDKRQGGGIRVRKGAFDDHEDIMKTIVFTEYRKQAIAFTPGRMKSISDEAHKRPQFLKRVDLVASAFYQHVDRNISKCMTNLPHRFGAMLAVKIA
ncbi:hypothetical protein Ccrd_020678 [Cynara cardunculus var. scolymus]|uniref:Uncharacterized protein n=1 Tax=Cynara cardunculus var. scolymus TaxID=59895 RepID=A0A103Y203_CYNCS|nr:hypothetical protein Ccrd_020678 [Cynara cardunculus var. scolymus]